MLTELYISNCNALDKLYFLNGKTYLIFLHIYILIVLTESKAEPMSNYLFVCTNSANKADSYSGQTSNTSCFIQLQLFPLLSGASCLCCIRFAFSTLNNTLTFLTSHKAVRHPIQCTRTHVDLRLQTYSRGEQMISHLTTFQMTGPVTKQPKA